jgi:hypothetical protein
LKETAKTIFFKKKTTSSDEIGKENKQKTISICVIFSNSRLGLSNGKHQTRKNHETQSLTNQTLKDEIEKKSIAQKD